MSERIGSFAEFWPFYLSQHARPATRWLHFAGTNLGVACLATAIWTGDAWWVLYGLVGSYGLAWIAHLVIERNRPATFTYPLWSFLGDFRMCAAMWTGRLWAG